MGLAEFSIKLSSPGLSLTEPMLSISHSVEVQLCLKLRNEVYDIGVLILALLSMDLGKCSNKLVSAWLSTPDPNPNAISNPTVIQSLGIHGFLITEHNLFKCSGSCPQFFFKDQTKPSTKTSHCES